MKYTLQQMPWEPKKVGARDDYDSNDNCKDCGVGWIFLSALEYTQKEHESPRSLNIQLKSQFENQSFYDSPKHPLILTASELILLKIKHKI